MSKPIITVEGLSKEYQVGIGRSPYSTVRESLVNSIKAPFTRRRSGDERHFWALKDVSFEIMPGEVVGIVGRNGAGKSTVLKILSRITEPTKGRVELFGRVGSLLEVGTGFHPELTGRENIFLNGAILGMKRAEIAAKFDEIVAFAEIEKFIDTPVKFYSSGMYTRLAFAVAAHLESEILVVDEVLAVGDSQFQKKCLGKMEDVSRKGRTVLFVSHNLASLNRLCRTGIYLSSGEVRDRGSIQTVLAKYQTDNATHAGGAGAEVVEDTVPENAVRFVDWYLSGAASKQDHACFSRDEAVFKFVLVCRRPLPKANFGFVMRDTNDQMILTGHSVSGDGISPIDLAAGKYLIEWRARLPLKAGNYKLNAAVASSDEGGQMADSWDSPRMLTVLPVSENNLPDDWQGVLNVPVGFDWEPLK